MASSPPAPAGPGSRSRLPPLAAALLLLAVAALLFAPYRRFTTDDAFIHYRFAENLAAGRGWSYNAGEPTHGDTAPLWVLLLAGLAPLAGGVPAAAKWLAAGAIAASVLLFAALARRFLPVAAPRWAVPAVAGLFLLDPWFLKWGLSGMETPLAVALALLALLLRERRRGTGRADPWTPLVLGAGCLVRPEFVLLIAALAIDVIASDRGRRAANLVLLVLLPGAIVLPWVLMAHATFGVVLPNTLGARRDLAYSTLYRLTKMAKILASAYLVPVAALALASRRSPPRRLVFPLVSAGLVLAFYLAWGVSVGARYLLLVTPFLLLGGYGAVFRLLAPRSRILVLVLAAIQLIVVQVGFVRFVTRWPEGMDPQLFALAGWLRDRTPAEAVVAAHEIGVIGYVSGRRILDLAGLVSPEVPPVVHTGSVAASLEVARTAGAPVPDYLVGNANEDPDRALLADMGGRLVPLARFEVQREGSSHRGGSQFYTIYRLAEGRMR